MISLLEYVEHGTVVKVKLVTQQLIAFANLRAEHLLLTVYVTIPTRTQTLLKTRQQEINTKKKETPCRSARDTCMFKEI